MQPEVGSPVFVLETSNLPCMSMLDQSADYLLLTSGIWHREGASALSLLCCFVLVDSIC